MTNAELDRKAAEAMGWSLCKTDCGKWWFDAEGTELIEAVNWHPTTNRDQAALLEAEIERRGLQGKYISVLLNMIPASIAVQWWFLTAPPAARVAAAVSCLEAEGKSE